MINSLNRWMGALGETVLDIMKLLPLGIQDSMKAKISKYVKYYERKEGEDSATGKKEEKKKREDEEEKNEKDDEDDEFSDLKNKLPLPEGVLKVNLGIPIIVDCNKVDLLIRGEKASYLESNLDFI